jgi:hypothetical protein
LLFTLAIVPLSATAPGKLFLAIRPHLAELHSGSVVRRMGRSARQIA